MRRNNGSLYEERQNRGEDAARSGRRDETKRDERDNLHCDAFSHSAVKDTGEEESSGPLPAEEQSPAVTTPPIRTRYESFKRLLSNIFT